MNTSHAAPRRSTLRKREALLMSFGANLSVLERAYRAAANQAVAHVGLSQSMAWPLIMIGRYGEGLRQGMLANLLGIEGPSLVRSLDQLQEGGFIERHEDALDRRAKTMHLTAAGQHACSLAEAALREMRAGLFEGFDEEELTAMERFMQTLQVRLGCAHLMLPPLPKATGVHET